MESAGGDFRVSGMRKGEVTPTTAIITARVMQQPPKPNMRFALTDSAGECLIQIRQDVLDVLETDGEPDIVRCDAGGFLFLRRQL